MSKVQLLTFDTLKSILSSNGLYQLAFSFNYGMSIWVTFIGGVIAFKTLPRQQFGNLQHRTFPIYFTLSSGLSAGLLAIWTLRNPQVLDNLANPRVAEVAQAYALASAALANAANLLVIGPMTSKTMFERHRLEREEGKTYDQPGVSAKMKALTKRFGALHGVSSLLNLGTALALTFHGLWIGNSPL